MSSQTKEAVKDGRDQSARSIYSNAKTGTYLSFPASSGFEHLGINEGDILIFQKDFGRDDENQLTLWQSLESYRQKSNEYVLGFVGDNFGDKTVTWGDKRIENYKRKRNPLFFEGVLVGVLKPYDATKYFKWNGEPIQTTDTEAADEITVICANCEKEETGSPSFFRGLGWHITEDAAHCPACW